MATQIRITYNKKDYTLEYTRTAISSMERSGFVGAEAETKPATMIPLLFSGAFQVHHPSMRQSLIDEIYDSMGNKDGLVTALSEMYEETMETLVSDGEKNTKWEKISL